MRRGVVNKFNRGELDPRALTRDDVNKVNNSCSLINNFLPQRLGPMGYRPGTVYSGAIPNASYLVPFIAAADDSAILEFDTTGMRVWVDDDLVTRIASNLTLTNETFDTNITGWTDASTIPSLTAWQTGGYALLLGGGTTSAKLWQTMGDTGAYVGVETAIKIVVVEAPVLVKIGENGVDSDDIFSGTLQPGTHSLVITPVAAHPTITLISSLTYSVLVSEVSIEPAGILDLPLPDTVDTLSSIRYYQSADVVFCGSSTTPQFRVERRGTKSWSVVEYLTNDGPFGLINNTDITLTPSALTGNTTLTASDDLFTASSVGEIYKLVSAGQTVSALVTAQDTGTDSVRVTGEGAFRDFTLSIGDSWSGTVTLQRSTDDATWIDVESHTANITKVYNDGLDGSILYYRLWVKTGDFTSGLIQLSIVYAAGSIDGICRVTAFTTAVAVTVQVISPFGAVVATRNWYTGEWSETLGFPKATTIYEGRLWWAGRAKLWGSVSDAFQSFDTGLEGDSASIRRTVGFGPVETVDWLAPSSRLIMGIASDEISVRSSSFGEVLSPSNTNLKSGSTQGSAPIDAVKTDDSILFVQRSGVKVMEATYANDLDSHRSLDLMTLHPNICKEGIKRIAIARQPETRVFIVMDDGTMRIYLQDPAEDVAAWSRWSTDGLVEDVVVRPGPSEDIVNLIVNRGGNRNMERISLIGNMVAEHFDAAVLYTSPGTTITGLTHLEGETVGVWGDNEDRGTEVVSSGQITVGDSWTDVTVGLPYVANYVSNKVGKYVKASVLGTRKRVVDVHLDVLNLWPLAIQLGPSLALLEDMPLIEGGTDLDLTAMIDEYDELPFEFNGEEEVDPRIFIQATAPCEILALTYGVQQDGDSSGQED